MNHFWTLTHEVGFHLHIPPTVVTHLNIQTDLTHRIIPAEKRRKKKNEEKEKVKKVFLLKRQTGKERKMGRDGISICSCYISWSALWKRELGQMKWLGGRRSGVTFLQPILITPYGGKTIDSRAPVSKVESKTLHRRKGTLQVFSRGSHIDELVLQAFSRGSDIHESVLLVFGGSRFGMVTCFSYCWSCRGSGSVQLVLDFLIFRYDGLVFYLTGGFMLSPRCFSKGPVNWSSSGWIDGFSTDASMGFQIMLRI